MYSLKNLTPFQLARVKLTLWYFLGFTCLVVFFTLLAFDAKQSAFFRVYTVANTNSPNSPQVVELNNKLTEFNDRFRKRVLIFDAIILVAATFASYFLSGKTLEPIQRMLEEQAAFAADVSHSLRTPLTTIGLEIEAYTRTKKASPGTQTLLTSIKEELMHMTHITQGLLTLVRSQNQEVNPHETIELASLIGKVADQMRPIITNHHQRLNVATLKTVRVKGNTDQLKQVMLILLENAVKYNSKRGSIAISLTKGARKVSVSVEDTGHGIPKNDIPLLTKRFYRGSNQKTIKGTGLGLSIAQKILDSHKGTLTIKSKLGKGTTCTITLPRA